MQSKNLQNHFIKSSNKNSAQDFLDNYFYAPNTLQKLLCFVLLPFSLVYLCIASFKRKLGNLHIFGGGMDFGVPLISVGNIIAGGSGKTPFIIYLAEKLTQRYDKKICVISRGYGRKSRGLVWVAKEGKICATVQNAGDEPYLIAKTLVDKKIYVLVSKDRIRGIKEAIKEGAEIILLDDAFRFGFSKFDILLRPHKEPYFRFCLPSGLYREWANIYNSYQSLQNNTLPNQHFKKGVVLKDGLDFARIVKVQNPSEKMLLLSAIANPSRLDSYLQDYAKNIVCKITLKDHATFDKEKIQQWLESYGATSILTTQKDEVKLESFGLPLSIMKLHLEVDKRALDIIIDYIESSLR